MYISSSADGSVWLALCLYNQVFDYPGFDVSDGLIINTRTGKSWKRISRGLTKYCRKGMQILQLIETGKSSKEIANQLSISVHTTNKHRQNIFLKLNAGNAMEACRIAYAKGLL